MTREETGDAPVAAPGADELVAQMLTVNARRVVLLGTVAFAIGFAVLIPFWSSLGDHRVWLWTCLAGAILGLLGLPLVDRHKRAGRLG